MKAERKLEPVKDASHLYEVERRDRHAERPGFRISELQLSPTQTVPWHFHTNISDTFYVLRRQDAALPAEPQAGGAGWAWARASSPWPAGRTW